MVETAGNGERNGVNAMESLSNMRTHEDPLRRYLQRPHRRRLAEVVRTYHQFVWDTAFRVTGNAEDAADICQDVFLHLLLRPPPADRLISARGYLACRVSTLARRFSRACARRNVREQIALERASASGLPCDDTEALRGAVGELPDDLRVAIELHYFAGLKNREIAEIMEISERTVEERLRKGRETIEKQLTALGVAALLLAEAPLGASAAEPAELLSDLLRVVEMGCALAYPGAVTGTALLTKKGAAIVGLAGLFVLILGGVVFLCAARQENGPRTQKCGVRAPAIAAEGEVSAPSLPDAVAATATLRASLLGTVVDGMTEEPLDGAVVLAVSHDAAAVAEEVQTALDGEFRLSSETLPARILVRREGYFALAFTFPEANVLPDEGLVLPLLPAGPFLGKVIDAQNDAPVAGAVARFFDSEGNTVADAQTDEEGQFSLSVASLAVYVGQGKKPWVALDGVSLGLAVEARGFSPFLSFSPLAQVRPRELNTGGARVLVVLQPEIVIDGIVRDAKGLPVAGATVAWAWQVVNGLSQSSSAGTPTSTDNNGGFVWRGPAPTRSSVVWAIHPDHGPGWIFVDRPLRKGIDLLEITLQLRARLRGRVVDESGNGIAGARVELQPKDVPPTWHYLSGKIVRELYGATPPWLVATANDGSFEIAGLGPGLHWVSVTRTGLVAGAQTEKEILIGEDTQWQAVMVVGRTVECSVTNEAGALVTGARVRFMVKGTRIGMGILGEDHVVEDWVPVRMAARPSEDGKFVMRGLPNGPVRVEAFARGFRRAQIDVDAAQSSVAVVLLEGSESTTEEGAGRGVDLNLSVKSGPYAVDACCVIIDFYAPGASKRFAQRMGEVKRGRARVADAPCGLFDVVVETGGFEPAVLRGVAVPSQEPLDVRLARTVPVDVTIDASGPIKHLSVYDGEGRRLRNAMVEGGNESSLDGLPPGSYWLKGRGFNRERYATPAPIVFSGKEGIVVKFERVQDEEGEME